MLLAKRHVSELHAMPRAEAERKIVLDEPTRGESIAALRRQLLRQLPAARID